MLSVNKDKKNGRSGLISYLALLGIITLIDLVLFNISFGSKAIAQVTADTTLGTENSFVNDTDPQKILIEGGARPKQDQNLFHSFEEFNVNEGQTVYFVNLPGVNLILSRVTGSNPSNILGRLKGDADLILLNPNGIFFGENASLDINGSFLATTATSILFEDGTHFSASDSSVTPLLTIKTPMGLQFGNRAESIINQSIARDRTGSVRGLELSEGKTLTFVGGDILVEGGYFTGSGGNIELASIAENNQVGLQQTEKGWALDYQNTQNFRDITIDKGLQQFGSFTSEIGSQISLSDGEIKFQGRNIAIKGGSQVGLQENVNIIVNASESLEVSGGLSFGAFRLTSQLITSSFDTGDAGNITINTGKLIVREGGSIETIVSGLIKDGQPVSPGSGQAGELVIKATESVEIADTGSSLASSTQGLGDGGTIKIDSPQLILKDGAQIFTDSIGKNSITKELRATGKGGNIEIINAELVELDNGSSISAKTQGLGADAGDINIETNNLIVRSSSEINVSATSNSAAGNLTISANQIELDNGQLTANTLVGSKGNIVINTDNLFLSNQSLISTNAQSTDGGNIIITTDNLVAINNSDIIANAAQGKGGRVEITAQGIFGIEARDAQTPASDITTSSELGVEFSGEIIINTPEVDPSSGLIELPSLPVDAETLITQNSCALKNGRIADGSSFIVVGRGGLPPSADDPLINQGRIVDWVSSTEAQASLEGIEKLKNKALLNQSTTSPHQVRERKVQISPEIQQAQGLIKTEDGKIFLTANALVVSPQTGAISYPYCQN